MPGKRVTEDQKRRYWKLRREAKLPSAAAADRVGVSRTTGWRWERALESADDSITHAEKRRQLDLPDPKQLSDLDGGVKDTLDDFALWVETFLAWDRVPWQRDAANIVVEKLLDRGERSYGSINVPPGSGKSSVFTFAIPAWLLCGGGFSDPTRGRALRVLLGHYAKKISVHYVLRLRRLLEMRRPFYNREQRRYAELVPAMTFGRFKPDEAQGEESLWSQEQFLVAQFGEMDLYEKEPSVQAASKESGFLGERVDYYSWDDLVTLKTARNPEVSEDMNRWFEDEAEPRLEPGGVGLLVGQRLHPNDLFRKRLDVQYPTEDGGSRRKYFHIVYPVHSDITCDGDHREWDLDRDGCLLDPQRHPWPDVLAYQANPNYQTVYQQKDADPTQVLVLQEWLDGVPDPLGHQGPGCWDEDRGFYEWPKVSGLINFVTVDPAAGNWWAIEWWAVHPESKVRYLIAGWRKRMQAGDLLDYSQLEGKHTGLMEDLQVGSMLSGQPIRVWVIESNAAFKHLFQYDHFRTWQRRWHEISVIPHTSGQNKYDPELGIEATLPMAYRTGIKRLPRKRGDPSWLNYLRQKQKELTTYPYLETFDTVMADWFGEANLERVLALGRRSKPKIGVDLKLPPYLRRRSVEHHYA